MNRRRFLAAVLGCGTLSGCADRATPSPAQSPSQGNDSLVVAGGGDHPHPIRVENTLDRAVSLIIRVERDGTTVYQDEHTVDARADVVVASITRSSLSESSRSVTVTASEAAGEATSVTVPISASVWYIRIYYGSNGTLKSTYATQ